MHNTTFLCPLCLERGRTVTLLAELDLDPRPPEAVVTDLWGLCEHADVFGEVEHQTLEEAWRLIEAALNAAKRGPARRERQ